MLDLLDRLEFVRSHETGPRLTRFVSPLLVRQFANRGARHTLQHLRGYEINKRLGITSSYLLECQPMLLDEITGMFTRLAGRWFNRAEKRRWRSFQDHGRTINQKLHEFVRLGDALVAARNNKTDLEAAVEAARLGIAHEQRG